MKKIAAVLVALSLVVAVSAQSKVTLKMGDNIPDRTAGYGAVIEQINTEFKAANPGVEFVTESYPDQPWQQKVKIYVASKQLPDVLKYWSLPSMLNPLVAAKMVEPLPKATFAKYGYLPGALEGNMIGGKLYGIPVSADTWVLYYNKKLFKDAGIDKIPTTIDELIATVPKFKAKNIIPISTDGKDAWPLCITFHELAWRLSGDASLPQKALDRKAKFTDVSFVKAAKLLQELTATSTGLFQQDLMVSDYGAARNLFGQGRAAMYLMGGWEMGLATDANFSKDFTDNVAAFKFPIVTGGKGKIDDLFAWYGGNNIISATSKNKAMALKYLEFYAKRFPAVAWEKQAAFPAQTVTPRDSDTEVAKNLLAMVASAKSTSGTPFIDLSTAEFKDDAQRYIGELCVGLTTPEEFCKKLDASAEKAFKKK